MIAGCVYSTSSVLRNAISVIGTARNCSSVSSFFFIYISERHVHRKKIIAYADCG
ncbi:MAG: hypothetical protein IPM96_14115 [Ignavibacteria bacterium]|nr:hypothetical protein [Ignavibacteria bacterium]